MPPSLKMLQRDARSHDHPVIREVLAAAFADGAVAGWLDPYPSTRCRHTVDHVHDTVQDALDHGIVRVVEADGEVVAAALWRPTPTHTLHAANPTNTPTDAAHPRDDIAHVTHRLRLLQALMLETAPRRPHHYLHYLGVRPDRQNHGIGTHLLTAHHSLLDTMEIPAFAHADDARNHALLTRHGYTDIGGPIALPDGPPIWPMWREPPPLRHTDGAPDARVDGYDD